MSSRKKPHRPPIAPAVVMRTPAKKRLFVLGIGLITGAILGAIAGIVVFITHHSPISAGTFTADLAPAKVSDKDLYATYAGAAACRDCHRKEYDAWSQSHHGQAERDLNPALDKPAFDPPRTFEHGSQKTTVRAAGDRYEVITPDLNGADSVHAVARVIGVDPLRQFLVPTTGGRLQTLEASYDPSKNQWFNVYGAEDRKPGEWGHWTGRGMNWNSQCAACHNTRVRKNYDDNSDSYQTAMAELTVSCESCHGPMKQHAQQKKYGLAASAASSPTTAPHKFTSNQSLDTCATCHARRADLTGEFSPGDSFHDHYSLAIPDHSDLFYPDGQIKEEDYEFTAFSGSKMHAAGVRCADCHDPHSSKTLFQGNNLCMRCHNGSFKGSPVIVPEQHSFHKTDSPGNQCINCHMPQTTYMQRHARHDHGFTTPDPLLTKEFNIPNACNRCHTDKDADWSLAAADKWFGAKMQRPTRERARTIAKARRGDDAARAPLLQMLKEEKPFWQAVSAAVLSPWAAAPDVLPALINALDHADPLVRENAARSLELLAQEHNPDAREALAKHLHDPIRAVRLRVAWALRDTLPPRIPPMQDLLASIQFAADQPNGQMQLGLYHLARKDYDPAIACFKKAIAWDPNSAPFYESLALALSRKGNTAQAVEPLQQAIRLDPRKAEYPYKLALAYSELHQLDRAIQFFNQTLTIDARHSRAAYNLGLAYNQSNQPDQAIAALNRAESINPNDPQIPYALATIYFKLNQKQEARDAAMRSLRLDPANTDAAGFLQALGR